jgi:hypothetical protein
VVKAARELADSAGASDKLLQLNASESAGERADTLEEALAWMALVAGGLGGRDSVAEMSAKAAAMGGLPALQKCLSAVEALRGQLQQSQRLAVSSSDVRFLGVG